MKKKPEYVEGREAFRNFEAALDAVMKVPHSEIKAEMDKEKREKERQPRPRRKSA